MRESGSSRAIPSVIREESMKSIWWTIAMLVLAASSLLANKVLAEDQPHTNGTAITMLGGIGQICVPTR